jgi:hypothetical protein
MFFGKTMPENTNHNKRPCSLLRQDNANVLHARPSVIMAVPKNATNSEQKSLQKKNHAHLDPTNSYPNPMRNMEPPKLLN